MSAPQDRSEQGAPLETIVDLASRSMLAWKEGDTGQAGSSLVELRRLDPQSVLWPCLLARLHLASGVPSQALATCEGVCPERHPELLLVRGLARFASADVAGATADLSRVRDMGGLGKEANKELHDALRGLKAPSAVHRPVAAQPALQTSVPREQPVSQPVAVQATPAVTGASEQEACRKKVRELVAEAKEEEKQGILFKARQLCEEALALERDTPEAVLCIARTALQNAEYSVVNHLFRQYPAVLKTQPHGVEALSMLASVQEMQGEWDAAAMDLEKAVNFARRGRDVPLDDLNGRLARAYWRGGEFDEAKKLAQRVLEGASTQREACEVACAAFLGAGDSAKALSLMIHCLIAKRDERRTGGCADLVCGVMRQCSVEELCHVLAPQGTESVSPEARTSIAEVVAYIGLIMKEQSEVPQACSLYRRAAVLAPFHASLCLNLMHCYSVRQLEVQAIAWGVRFFDFLKSVPAATTVASGMRDESREPVDLQRATAVAPALRRKDVDGIAEFNDVVAIGFVLVKLLYLTYPYLPMEASQDSCGPPSWQSRLTVKTEGDLVKPVYNWRDSGGWETHLQVLRKISAVMDRSREGQELQRTAVRNEHAYFLCIVKILASLPPIVQPTSPLAGAIFLVGDSHVVPAAWRSVDVRGSRHVLVPCLVTGVKIWHLRAASKFHTKYNFWERLGSLPRGAPLILCLGEIDCREGVVRAVQKGLYSNLEQSLKALVDLFLEVLRECRRRLPRSQIFVHPIPEVLPETRILTVCLNRLLRSRGTRDAMTKLDIRCLEFSHVFVEGPPNPDVGADVLAKLTLMPELELDGTHMNPSYVQSHLEPALASAWRDVDAD